VPLDDFENLRAFRERLLVRPAVREALAFEKSQHDAPFAA
jgi:hypothetical protein